MLAFWAGGAANSGAAQTVRHDGWKPQTRSIEQDDEEVLLAVAFLLRSM